MLNNRAELHRLRLNRSSPQTWRRSHRQNRSNEESELDERQIHRADARPCGYEAARGAGSEYELKFDSLSRGRSQGAACSAHADAQNAVCEVRKNKFPASLLLLSSDYLVALRFDLLPGFLATSCRTPFLR
jgi:hypothetical protein